MRFLYLYIVLFIIFMASSCSNKNGILEPVSYAQFKVFVEETGYITDAERYGWSVVQIDVFNFKTVENATWRQPDGVLEPSSDQLPVTQVSYNDAVAYCQWAGKRLPTYDEYWDLVKTDNREVVSDNRLPISEVDKVNVLGNVWDITETDAGKPVRLAGGSLFCSPNTCHGTVKDRELYVDRETGNVHIGFSVIK